MDKSIVFDLDETIGYFKQFIYILNILESYNIRNYNKLLNIFNFVFRPNIFKILFYIKDEKIRKKIQYIILYTNNNNNKFVNIIINYIHSRLNYILFDKIITLNHELRTIKSKNYQDLIHCVNEIEYHKLCFIDDKRHTSMKHSNVFFIQCEKYTFNLDNIKIIKLLIYHYPQLESYSDIKNKIKKYKYTLTKLPLKFHEHNGKKLFDNINIFIESSIIIDG